jgi:hypothetical protein
MGRYVGGARGGIYGCLRRLSCCCYALHVGSFAWISGLGCRLWCIVWFIAFELYGIGGMHSVWMNTQLLVSEGIRLMCEFQGASSHTT